MYMDILQFLKTDDLEISRLVSYNWNTIILRDVNKLPRHIHEGCLIIGDTIQMLYHPYRYTPQIPAIERPLQTKTIFENFWPDNFRCFQTCGFNCVAMENTPRAYYNLLRLLNNIKNPITDSPSLCPSSWRKILIDDETLPSTNSNPNPLFVKNLTILIKKGIHLSQQDERKRNELAKKCFYLANKES